MSAEEEILRTHRTIAVVGISADPDKPSHSVPKYLQEHGYRIIPVNPRVREVLGEKCYPDLCAIPEPVDIVQIFRRPRYIPNVVAQAMYIGARAIWMQQGIVHEVAARKARAAGIEVVMDRCMRTEHRRL